MSIDIENAKNDDPEGSVCGFCGQENDFADDCGWIYSSIEHIDTNMPDCHGIPTCRSCWKGMIGPLHIDLHGLGDR